MTERIHPLGISGVSPAANYAFTTPPKTNHFDPIPIRLDRHGLLDPTAFLDYQEGCVCHELVTPQAPYSCKPVEGHHGYFPESSFKPEHIPLNVKWLRSSKFNIFDLRSCQEDLYHQTHAESVPIADINLESAARFIEESGTVFDFAVAHYGLEKAVQARENLPPRSRRYVKARADVRVELLSEQVDEKTKELELVEVIHPEVVTGALKKYSDLCGSKALAETVNQRLQNNPVSIPTQVYGEAHLRSQVEAMLVRKLGSLSLGMRRAYQQRAGLPIAAEIKPGAFKKQAVGTLVT